jgi:hypothetical protein
MVGNAALTAVPGLASGLPRQWPPADNRRRLANRIGWTDPGAHAQPARSRYYRRRQVGSRSQTGDQAALMVTGLGRVMTN